MAIESRQNSPYSFIEKYTEYEVTFVKELINQSLFGIDLLRSNVSNEISKYSAEELEGNPISCKYDNLKKTIPNYLNRVHFILLFSLFEKTLKELIMKAEEEENSEIKTSDLKGSEFEIYYKYCTRVLFIDLKKVNNEWSIVKQCQSLRNNILHNYSEHKIELHSLENIVNSFDEGNLVIEDDEIKIIDKQFNIDFCNTYLSFFKFIVDELNKRYLIKQKKEQTIL